MKTNKSASIPTTQFDATVVGEHGLNKPGLLGCGLLGSEPKFAPPSACSKLRSDPKSPRLQARKLCPELGSDPKNPTTEFNTTALHQNALNAALIGQLDVIWQP